MITSLKKRGVTVNPTVKRWLDHTIGDKSLGVLLAVKLEIGAVEGLNFVNAVVGQLQVANLSKHNAWAVWP